MAYAPLNIPSSHAITVVDEDLRIVAILAGMPDGKEGWQRVCTEAAKELLKAGEILGGGKTHRRGEFQTLVTGFSFGGGQTRPMNCAQSKVKANLVQSLNKKECFQRIASFGSCEITLPLTIPFLTILVAVFESWAPKLHGYYKEKMGHLLDQDESLEKPFRSVFPAATYNLGPQTVCRPHLDFANLPFGYCVVTSFGQFDYRKGGHMVLDEYKLILEFPAGSTILIQSAIVTHSNLAVGEGETRYSFTQYAAGGLFRWVDNGFMTSAAALKVLKEAEDEEGLMQRAEADTERWRMGLGLVPKLYEYVDV